MPITKEKISYKLDLREELKRIPKEKRKEVTEEIGIALIDAIEGYTSNSTSPVSGGAFKKQLSEEYAKKAGKKTADLYLKGDMLGSLNFRSTQSNVTLEITKGKEKLKAYNHNTGDTLPVRKFLPDDEEGEKFKKPIIDMVKRIIKDAEKDA